MIAGRARLRFFASKYIAGAATTDVKTPTGSMRVSARETTLVDLVRFARSAGGLDNVATIFAELSPAADPRLLIAAVRMVHDVPNTQRLGYILDHVRQRRLSDPIHAWLERQKPHALPLQSGQPANHAKLNRRWNVLVNRLIEVEA
jgi:predicted transcriptional regulator of viral defense system